MWHTLGEVGQKNETAKEVNSRMIDVSFEQRLFHILLNGKLVSDNKHFGIIRLEGDTEHLIGETKAVYNLTQPIEYIDLYDTFVGEPVETLGYLGSKGQKMFITWELPSIDVHGDKVETYGFLAVGFDGKFSEKLYQTNVRVVCQNTWSAAVSNEDNKVYSGKHTMVDHMERLGAWMKHLTKDAYESVALHEKLFCKMEETPAEVDLAYQLFAKVYPKKGDIGAFYPDELRTKDQTRIDEFNQSQEEKRDFCVELFQGRGIEISKSVWGVWNCVTEFENHWIPSKKSPYESIIMGGRHKTMSNAMLVMQEAVGE